MVDRFVGSGRHRLPTQALAPHVTSSLRAAAASLVVAAAVAAAAAAGACRPRSDSAAGRPCSSSAPCAADEYCAYERQLCGKAARPGACRPIPVGCDSRLPVCGCDGKAYPNECAAHAAKVDLDVTGACREDVPDFIHCGPRFCDAREQYCEIYLSDVVDPPSDYSCKPLPPGCAPEGGKARTCDCFPRRTACLSFCGPIQTGGIEGVHLTCQGVKKPAL
jgi:hypothetical protein